MGSVQVFGCKMPLNVLVFFAAFAAVMLANEAGLLAQPPWEQAANRMAFSFQGLSRPATIVAFIVGGLMLMFGDGGVMRTIGGVIVGAIVVLNPEAIVDMLDFSTQLFISSWS